VNEEALALWGAVTPNKKTETLGAPLSVPVPETDEYI